MFRKLVFAFVAALSAIGVPANAANALRSGFTTDGLHRLKLTGNKLPPQVGNERWIVLLCRFADSPRPVPYAKSAYDAAFNTDPKSHKNYFKEASYGKLNISAKVTKWRTIPARNTFAGSFQTRGEAFGFDLYDACTKVHDAHSNFGPYEGIAMFFDDREKDVNDGTACQFGDTCTNDRSIGVSGYAYYDLSRSPLDGVNGFRVIWMKNLGAALNEVTAHEMHHAYGAPHSAAGIESSADDECWDPGQGRDICGHYWDLMAGAWTGVPTDTHTLAATKVFYHKWISGKRRCNVVKDVVDQVFEVERLARPRKNSRCLAITIKQPGSTSEFTNWYVVEARFPKGFDADSSPAFNGGGIPGAAVIISRVCIGTHPFCNPEPVVLGTKSNGAGMIDEKGAEWQPGETFVSFHQQIKVQVMSRGAGFYTVKVTRDSTP